MTKVIGVRFRTAGKVYFFDPLHDGEPDRSLKYAIYRFENGEYAQVY